MHAEPNAIPEEEVPEEPAVTPGDDSNDDPTPPLPVDPSGTPQRNPAVDQAANDTALALPTEEPEIGNERDIPSDGRDPEGEGMIRELDKPVEPSPAAKPERE
ncbi:MAG: hypothetical protein Q8M93_03365 [Polaromonas sp.]|uniref:hypothetical protein n=1 Tax=Polaromonas sp. TaxID=1869339 RepID=UPI002731283D|nr:hypothetical protein [Polaromonas sp.]MDP2448337.1 hypothetical protein [Polaromonas sp.]MDP3245984.1 hypothetical protein [Polaromonas sp.]MDP3757008.1 hypothetical protein [Polaromonas sp.]MDP3827215.1 hypothetical protein [Polaromonas sp.]